MTPGNRVKATKRSVSMPATLRTLAAHEQFLDDLPMNVRQAAREKALASASSQANIRARRTVR